MDSLADLVQIQAVRHGAKDLKVLTALAIQRFVRACFYHLAVFYHHKIVGVDDLCDVVRDHNYRAVFLIKSKLF